MDVQDVFVLGDRGKRRIDREPWVDACLAEVWDAIEAPLHEAVREVRRRREGSFRVLDNAFWMVHRRIVIQLREKQKNRKNREGDSRSAIPFAMTKNNTDA